MFQDRATRRTSLILQISFSQLGKRFHSHVGNAGSATCSLCLETGDATIGHGHIEVTVCRRHAVPNGRSLQFYP